MIKLELELTRAQAQMLAALVGWGGHQALLSKLYADTPDERSLAAGTHNLAQHVEAKIIAAYNEEVKNG